MSETTHTSSPADTKATKPSRQPKPSFDQFLEALKAAVAKPPKASLPEVRRIVNNGFSDKENFQLVSRVAEILKAYPDLELEDIREVVHHEKTGDASFGSPGRDGRR